MATSTKLHYARNPLFSQGQFVVCKSPVKSHDEGADVIAVQSDGRIVMVGHSSAWGSGTGYDFALARYNSDGSLDTSFGTDGKVTTDFGSSYDHANGVAIDADRRIVVVGASFQSTSYDFALARYNSDGSLDTSFGTGGKVTTDFNSSYNYAHGVAIDGGKIVLVGRTGDDFAVARYNSNGSLDVTFGGDGKVTTDFGGAFACALDVAIDGGKIVVAGCSRQGGTGEDFALARYNSNGSLDTTFDGDGKVTTDFGGSVDVANGVAVDAAGKIVVAGYSYQGEAGLQTDFGLARYNADGSLDTTFGTGGLVTTDFGFNDTACGVAIDGDGKIVLGGHSRYDFALARYEADFGVGAISAPTDPVEVNTQMTASAIFTDRDLSHTHTAVWDWGDNTTSFGTVAEPTTESVGIVAGSHTYAATGVYTITLTVTVDQTGDSDQSVFQDVVVRRPVEIDVKPGSDTNPINLASNGVIAVAILTTESFDASWVDASTVVFAGAYAVQHGFEDVDADGDLDLVMHFRIEDTNLEEIYQELLEYDHDADGVLDSTRQEVEAWLFGQTTGAELFAGVDEMDVFLSGKHLRELLDELFGAGTP